jgi:hypothetical protein
VQCLEVQNEAMKHRPLRVALLALMVLAVFPARHAVAAGGPDHPGRSCGRVAFDYGLHRVGGGEVFDMDLNVTNCSERTERLRVRVRSRGPCAFAHPAAYTYRLLPHYSVGLSALIVAPSCPGRYSVHIRLTLAAHRHALDIAGDGFVVGRH